MLSVAPLRAILGRPRVHAPGPDTHLRPRIGHGRWASFPLHCRAVLRLLPVEPKFFDLFEKQAATVLEAARALQELAHNYNRVDEKAQHIKELESRGDHITHELISSLNRTFITPFDREDIHALASALDDVLDNIEGVSSRFALFKIEK